MVEFTQGIHFSSIFLSLNEDDSCPTQNYLFLYLPVICEFLQSMSKEYAYGNSFPGDNGTRSNLQPNLLELPSTYAGQYSVKIHSMCESDWLYICRAGWLTFLEQYWYIYTQNLLKSTLNAEFETSGFRSEPVAPSLVWSSCNTWFNSMLAFFLSAIRSSPVLYASVQFLSSDSNGGLIWWDLLQCSVCTRWTIHSQFLLHAFHKQPFGLYV